MKKKKSVSSGQIHKLLGPIKTWIAARKNVPIRREVTSSDLYGHRLWKKTGKLLLLLTVYYNDDVWPS